MQRIWLLTLLGFLALGLTGLSPSESPVVPPPDQLGPYAVGYFLVDYPVPPYGTYQAMIRYPARWAGPNAPKLDRQSVFPGIVVCNGFAGAHWNIKWIGEHLTSHGYVTLSFTPPDNISVNAAEWAAGFKGGLATLKAQNARGASAMSGLLDLKKFGIIGFSMGGGGCLQATAKNPEVTAAVCLAPAKGPLTNDRAENIVVPVQIQVGSEDGIVPPAGVLAYYTDAVPNSTIKEFVEIAGGNHIGYIDEFFANVAKTMGLDNPAKISVPAQHEIAARYFTAWFQFHIKGQSGYAPYIFGDLAAADLAQGKLSDLRINLPE